MKNKNLEKEFYSAAKSKYVTRSWMDKNPRIAIVREELVGIAAMMGGLLNNLKSEILLMRPVEPSNPSDDPGII